MIKRHRIFHILLNNAYKTMKQSTINAACQCTPVYTSKVLKKLIRKGIVAKHSKNTLVTVNPLVLAFVLAYEKRGERPLMFKASSYKDVIEILNSTTYSLTLDSALAIRKGAAPKVVEAYVLGKDVPFIEDAFSHTNKQPDLLVYPADPFRFNHQHLINNVFSVSDWDLIVDLASSSKINSALNFAKEYKLFKTIHK